MDKLIGLLFIVLLAFLFFKYVFIWILLLFAVVFVGFIVVKFIEGFMIGLSEARRSKDMFLCPFFRILGFLSARNPESGMQIDDLYFANTLGTGLKIERAEVEARARVFFDEGKKLRQEDVRQMLSEGPFWKGQSEAIMCFRLWMGMQLIDNFYSEDEYVLMESILRWMGFDESRIPELVRQELLRRGYVWDESSNGFRSPKSRAEDFFRKFFQDAAGFGFGNSQQGSGSYGSNSSYSGSQSGSSGSSGSSYSSSSASIGDLETAYSILGISSTTSDADAKKAYHRLMRRYHPDRVRSLSEAEQKRATEMSQKINAAWSVVKKFRKL